MFWRADKFEEGVRRTIFLERLGIPLIKRTLVAKSLRRIFA